jgi:phage terminase small subunit
MSTPTTLTAKQARFVNEFLVDSNGTRAAVAAGYGIAGARVAACRTLANDNVQMALQARQTADATRLSIQRDGVVRGLLEAFAMAREQRNPAAMVIAAREVGRMMGFYAPERHQVEVGVAESGMMKNMNEMSDAELVSLMAASD